MNFASKDPSKDSLKINFMKLISIDGKSILDYAGRGIFGFSCESIWNFTKNKFYNPTICLPTEGVLKVEQDGKIFDINIEDYFYKSFSITNFNIKIDGVPKRRWVYGKSNKVEFLKKEAILYIYLDNLYEDSDFISKIKELGKNKKIKKIVIDVRDCYGGSDLAWKNVLKAIIKDPLSYKIDLAYNDTEIMRKKFKEYEKISKPETITWLNNQKVRIINEESYITPDDNSLKYNGKIYVLTDEEEIRSAANPFVAYCSYQDKLVSVGTVSNRLSGFDKKTTLFQLKHSKYTFRLSTTMDITNCTKPEDIYHAFPEVIVNPSFEDGFLYKYSIYDTKSEEYLRKYDNIFKKVLELE